MVSSFHVLSIGLYSMEIASHHRPYFKNKLEHIFIQKMIDHLIYIYMNERMKEAHINGKSKKGRSTRCTYIERAREETVDCICIVLIVNLTVLIVCTISVCVRVCISFLLSVIL